jgi:hypothetical protein
MCGRGFRPDVRHRRDQKYCRPCAKKVKRARDRRHKQRYRETGLGREQRKRESGRRRERLDWARYMSYWRKAEPEKRARQERARARRHYLKHREQILRQRHAERAARKRAREARSH